MPVLLDGLNYAIELFRGKLIHPVVSTIVWCSEVLLRCLLFKPHRVKAVTHQFKKEEERQCCVNNSKLSFFDTFLCVNGVPAYFIDKSDDAPARKAATKPQDSGTSKHSAEASKAVKSGSANETVFAGKQNSDTVGVCAFSNDGSKFAIYYVSGAVTIWDTNTGMMSAIRSLEGIQASNVSFHGTKNSVLLIYTEDYICWSWDIDSSCSNLTKICERAASSKIDGEVASRRSNFYNSGEKLLLSSIFISPSGPVLEIASSDLPATSLWRSYSVYIRENFVISRTLVSQDGNGILVSLMDEKLVESYCLLWPSYNEAPSSYKQLDKGTIGSWSADGKHVVTWIMTNDLNASIDDGNSAFIWNVKEMRDNLTKFEYSFKPIKITNPFGGKVLWCQMIQSEDVKDRLVMSTIGEFTRVLFWDVETSTHTHTIETRISPKDMMLCNKDAWIESCVKAKNVKGLCPMDVASSGRMFGAILGCPSEIIIWDVYLGIEVLKVSPANVQANRLTGGIDLMASPSCTKFAIVGSNGVMIFCPSAPSINEKRAKNCLESQMVQLDNPHISQDNLARFKMSFSGDGDTLGVLCIGSSKMQVWNLPQGTSCTIESAHKEEGGNIEDFCLSNNGNYVAIYTKMTVQVWNCTTRKVANVIDMTSSNSEVVEMGINDDASEVVVCMKDGSISCYKLLCENIRPCGKTRPSSSSSQRHGCGNLSLVERIKAWFKRPWKDIRQALISQRGRDGPSLATESSIDIHEVPRSLMYPCHNLVGESNEATFQVCPNFKEVIRISETHGVEAWDLETKNKHQNGVSDVANVKRSSYAYSENSSITEPVLGELVSRKDELLNGTSIDLSRRTTLIQSSKENIIVAGNSSLRAISMKIDEVTFDFEFNEETQEQSHSIYVINLKDVEYRRRLSGRNLDPEKGLAISHDGRHVACLAGDFGAKVVVWNVYASERLLPDYNFLSLTLGHDMSRKEGIRQEILPLINNFGINFFNFRHPSGMSIFAAAIYHFNSYLLKVILQYARKKRIKVSFLFSRTKEVWSPTSKYHNVVEALVAKRLPKTLVVTLKYLLKRVTHEAEVATILKHSLIDILHFYPSIFVHTIRDSKLLGAGFIIEIPETSLEGRKFKVSTSDSLNLSKEERRDFWIKDLVRKEKKRDSWIKDFVHEEKALICPKISSNACTFPYEGACEIGGDGILRNLLTYGVHEHAYGSFVVGSIVDYKWRKYAKKLLLQELSHHGMVCISFTIYCFALISGESNKAHSDREHEDHSDLRTISLAVCLTLAAMCLYRELWQCAVYMHDHGFHGLVYWLKSAWNWIEMFSYINVIFIIPLGQWLFLKEGSHRAILSALVAVESLLLWSRMLFYARPFDHTGPLVVTISAIVGEIFYFLILALSVMFGFALAFCVLYRHVEYTQVETTNGNAFNYVDTHHNGTLNHDHSEHMHQAFGTFKRSFFTIFSYTFGDFNLEILYQAPEPYTALTLFVLYVGSLSIILLNMLIALMSEKVARIYEKRKTRVIEARARAIDDIDSMLSNKSREKIRYLQVIIPTHHHERVTKGCRVRQTSSKLVDEINTAIKTHMHRLKKSPAMRNHGAPPSVGIGLGNVNTTDPSPNQLGPTPEDGTSNVQCVEANEQHEDWYDSDSTDSNFTASYSEEDLD